MERNLDEDRAKKRPRYVAPQAPRTAKAHKGKTKEFIVNTGHAVFNSDGEKIRAGGTIMLTAEMARFHQKHGAISVEIKDFDDDEDGDVGEAASDDPVQAKSGSSDDAAGGEPDGGTVSSSDDEAEAKTLRRRR